MKRTVRILAVALACLTVATLVQKAEALPRYSYEDTYYDAEIIASAPTVFSRTYENGTDSMSCSGVRERDGVLQGRFWHQYQNECSTGLVTDQWWFWEDYCTTPHWVPTDPNYHAAYCAE
jgi:hypothetical protein